MLITLQLRQIDISAKKTYHRVFLTQNTRKTCFGSNFRMYHFHGIQFAHEVQVKSSILFSYNQENNYLVHLSLFFTNERFEEP